MSTLSPEVLFEKTMYRSGLQPCGGSISRTPAEEAVNGNPQGLQSWANGFAGLFIVDRRGAGTFDSHMTTLRDIVVFGLNDTSIEVATDTTTFQADGSTLNLVYLPRGTQVRYSTDGSVGLRSATVMLDVQSFLEAQGLQTPQLPRPIRDMLGREESVMERIGPCVAVTRVVEDIILGRGMYPDLAALYLESKTFELISSWMCHLSQRAPDGANHLSVDQRTRRGVALAKDIIDRKPALALNMELLGRAAAMNRTKLRAAFKAMYGMTLLEYRTTVLMARAERFLRESGGTVQEAAHLAGYSSASSFIVAFKGYFGVSPGNLRQ